MNTKATLLAVFLVATTPVLAQAKDGPDQTIHPGTPEIRERVLGEGPLFRSDKPRGTYLGIRCKNDVPAGITVYHASDEMLALAHRMFPDSAKGIVREKDGALRYDFFRDAQGIFQPLFTPQAEHDLIEDLATGNREIMRDGALDTDAVRRLAAAICKPALS